MATIGLDIGTTNAKGVLVSSLGAIATASSRPVVITNPAPDHFELDDTARNAAPQHPQVLKPAE